MATPEELRAQLQARHDKDVIAKAVAALAERGCSYRVIESDGSEHTNIKVVEKAAKKMVNKFTEETKYRDVIANIKPGGSDIVMAPDGRQGDKPYVESMRSSVYNYCKKLWGDKTFKIEIGNGHTHLNIRRNPEF